MSSNRTLARARLQRFVALLATNATLRQTYAFQQATMAMAYSRAYDTRCQLLSHGALASLSVDTALASVEAILVGIDNLVTGLSGLISELPDTAPAGSVAAAVRQAWHSSDVELATRGNNSEFQMT